jgi:hypothetical protein
MFVYAYSYKSDSLNEIIGSVHANNYEEALEKIAIIKQLDVQSILNIFRIERIVQ